LLRLVERLRARLAAIEAEMAAEDGDTNIESPADGE